MSIVDCPSASLLPTIDRSRASSSNCRLKTLDLRACVQSISAIHCTCTCIVVHEALGYKVKEMNNLLSEEDKKRVQEAIDVLSNLCGSPMTPQDSLIIVNKNANVYTAKLSQYSIV